MRQLLRGRRGACAGVRVSGESRDCVGAARALVAAWSLLALADGSRTLPGPATVHAAGGPEKPRCRCASRRRSAASGCRAPSASSRRSTHPPQVALESVRFYVNDALVGDDREGPPYAVEWTDANPFEPTRIRVDATDALGNTASDAIELAPFEIVETTGVSRVLLEATVMDKAGRFVGGLDAASFRVLENDEPQTIDLASIESLPVTYTLLVDASQSMHARMEFVRTAAGRLADFLRPNDRIIVAPFAKSLGRDHRAHRRSRHDRRRRAGDLVQRRHRDLRWARSRRRVSCRATIGGT